MVYMIVPIYTCSKTHIIIYLCDHSFHSFHFFHFFHSWLWDYFHLTNPIPLTLYTFFCWYIPLLITIRSHLDYAQKSIPGNVEPTLLISDSVID